MSGFQKKVLNPIVSSVLNKIDAALKTADVTKKVDLLLATKDEAKASLSKISNRQNQRATHFWLLGGLGGVLFSTTIAVLTTLNPIVILGATLTAAGIGLCLKFQGNATDVSQDKKTIEAKIDREIGSLIQTHPQEVSKSQRFQEFLKQAFNSAASVDEQYDKIAQRVAPTAPVPSRP